MTGLSYPEVRPTRTLALACLLLALGGCCTEGARGGSTGTTGARPTCADIACTPPAVCVDNGLCYPHCGCMGDANCPTGQFCGPTTDCGGTCGPCKPPCFSGVCSSDGTCCENNCPVGESGDMCAHPSGCSDDGGACTYPPNGTVCRVICGSDSVFTSTCKDQYCTAGTSSDPCPNHFGCADETECATTCDTDAGCAVGFSCHSGACVAN